jgi:hypothetical protein
MTDNLKFPSIVNYFRRIYEKSRKILLLKKISIFMMVADLLSITLPRCDLRTTSPYHPVMLRRHAHATSFSHGLTSHGTNLFTLSAN